MYFAGSLYFQEKSTSSFSLKRPEVASELNENFGHINRLYTGMIWICTTDCVWGRCIPCWARVVWYLVYMFYSSSSRYGLGSQTFDAPSTDQKQRPTPVRTRRFFFSEIVLFIFFFPVSEVSWGVLALKRDKYISNINPSRGIYSIFTLKRDIYIIYVPCMNDTLPPNRDIKLPQHDY